MGVIDCDQHLYESRTLWRDHIDPTHADDALRPSEYVARQVRVAAFSYALPARP